MATRAALDLKGKVAIVTGSTKGIGLAIAEALAAHGARVVISSRTADDVRRVAADFEKQHGAGSALGIPCDVGRYEDCHELVARTVKQFGRLDVLVNNAGVGGFRPVAEMEPERWRAVIETNLSGLFYCSREAIPLLKKSGDGWIINIGSLAGKNAFPGGAAYNASKFGLIGFSEALMQEVRHDNIRVTYIMPGSVATEFDGTSTPSGSWMIQPEDLAEIVLDLLRLPKRTLASRVEVRPSKPPKK
jgi:NAD(P)-dependent dehydrogenase (short-subunit alcohol dehydrogenase family)